MIYSTFGSNRPIVLALLIVPSAVFLAFSALSPLTHDFFLGGPVSDILYSWLGGYALTRRIIGILLIGTNAILLNSLYNRHDLATGENHFPALIYIILVGSNFENIDIHPAHFASAFIMLAMRRLLLVYRAESVLSIGFDSALFLATGVMFYPVVAILILLPWLVFLQVRPFHLKEWIAPVLGVAIVTTYAWSYYAIKEFPFEPDEFFDVCLERISLFSSSINWSGYLLAFLVCLTIVFGVISFFVEIPKSNLRKKSTKFTFVWLTVLLVISSFYAAFLKASFSGNTILLAIPCSVLAGAYYSSKKKKVIIQTVMFYALFSCSILYAVFSN